MLSKEEIKTCKEEARNYIEFMETAGDNAGWTRGLIWYIDQLETDKQNLIEKLEENNEKDKHTVQVYEEMYRNATEEFYKRSYKRTIDMANARRETRKSILEIVKGVENERDKI